MRLQSLVKGRVCHVPEGAIPPWWLHFYRQGLLKTFAPRPSDGWCLGYNVNFQIFQFLYKLDSFLLLRSDSLCPNFDFLTPLLFLFLFVCPLCGQNRRLALTLQDLDRGRNASSGVTITFTVTVVVVQQAETGSDCCSLRFNSLFLFSSTKFKLRFWFDGRIPRRKWMNLTDFTVIESQTHKARGGIEDVHSS